MKILKNDDKAAVFRELIALWKLFKKNCNDVYDTGSAKACIRRICKILDLPDPAEFL